MGARALQKADETVADVIRTGDTAAVRHDRTEMYIDSVKIYHVYCWYWVGRRAQAISCH